MAVILFVAINLNLAGAMEVTEAEMRSILAGLTNLNRRVGMPEKRCEHLREILTVHNVDAMVRETAETSECVDTYVETQIELNKVETFECTRVA